MPAEIKPAVSVIIPTYNRKDSLLQTLESLSQQTYPANRFEVIVVDDGGADGTGEIIQSILPFSMHYLRQENQGGVSARNRGAEAARGEVLVFLDDDMTLEPGYIASLANQFLSGGHILARGQLAPWKDYASIFARLHSVQFDQADFSEGDFCSNNLAIRLDDFWAIGGWQDLLPHASEHRGGIWSDLEFAVRARSNGYQLVTVHDARIVHRDYVGRTLDSACRRALMISKLAVPVVRTQPHLLPYMQMLHDKGPIDWRGDPASLIARKILRQIASSTPSLFIMEHTVPILERRAPASKLLVLFYRWIVSAYIYRGYRQGLRDLVESTVQERDRA